MEIQITTKKPVFDDQHGRLKQGQVIEVPQHKALFYIQRGEAVCYQTKVMQDRPYQAVGKVEQSSVLPPAQASQQTIATKLEDGVKKLRKKKEL